MSAQMPDANQPQWIAMSERKPVEDDFPIWAHVPKHRIDVVLIDDYQDGLTGVANWMPADVPAPPALPLSRMDQDFTDWQGFDQQRVHGINETVACVSSMTWHAAVAHERSEVSKLLEDSEDEGGNPHWSAPYRKLKARLAPRP